MVREDALGRQGNIGESIEAIEAIYRNAKRLQRLTNDILDVSRIDSQTLNLDKEAISLDDLLFRVVEDYKGHIRKDNRNISGKKSALQLSYTTKNRNLELIVEADRDIELVKLFPTSLTMPLSLRSKKGGTIFEVAEKRNGSKNDNQEVVVNIVDTGEGKTTKNPKTI